MIVVQAGDTRAIFDRRFTIGREGTFPVDDEYASKLHVACWPDGDGWVAQDLGTMNGTWLNGQKFYGPARLAKGDKLKVGHTTITVVPA